MKDAPKFTHETIFANALALPVGERNTFVDRACAGDLASAVQVKELLRGYEENSGFLEAPPASVDGAVAGIANPEPGQRIDSGSGAGLNEAGYSEHLREPVPGERIGHYKMLERIGEGACGVVYMAEQEHPVRRRVALKLIKLGLDTRDFIARFEAERQALALMDHANIARVFDAGATNKGRPYFVMELVRGIPITRYCDENHLAPPARLELFISVCHAIQHAHQKGIIHRDIKPSNILVAVNDGEAVPKVIDFGIAKATQGRLTDKTVFTRFHAFIGTPAYSSPEQAEVTNLDVDTRSDIYSLGVLLYELLTGHQPLDHATMERLGFEEMRRVIREVEPPRPSARVSSLGLEERTSVAQRRAVDTAKLALLLRSDLDWIVMRCLEKDRRRRYETASALAQDIRRHLDNEPVEARPPSAVYRIRKFVGRHKPAFVAVSGIAVALVAGLIVSSVLFLRERLAHTRALEAEQVEIQLRREAETARNQETKRAGRAALNLARQLLGEGKTTDALAYFGHAARKDPDNKTIAAQLVSVLTSRNFLLPERAPFACGSRVLGMRYSRDGRTVLVGTEDGTLRTFDAATGAMGREIRFGRPVKRNGWVFARDTDAVCAIRFVDDTVTVVDLASGHMRFAPIQLDAKVTPGEETETAMLNAGSLSLSTDGRWLMAEGLYEFWLWDAATGALKIQRTFPNYKFFDVSPDGTQLALVSGDALSVLSLPEGELVRGSIPIARHIARPGVYLMPRFSPDGRRLVVCDPWEAIHVFDVGSGELVHSWPHRDNWILPGSIQFLPDGRLFLGAPRSTELWDLEKGLVGQVNTVWWTALRSCVPDATGTRLLLTSAKGFARLSSTVTGERMAEETSLADTGDVVATLAPSGGQIVVGTREGEVRWLRVGRGAGRPLELPAMNAEFTNDNPARLRWLTADHTRTIDVMSGRVLPGGGPNPRVLNSLWTLPFFSPGAQFMVLPQREGAWEAWDYSGSGSPRVVRLAEKSDQHFYQFSPLGNHFAFLGRGGREVGVWNLSTGALVGPMVSYEEDDVPAWSVDLTADAKRLVTGHSKGTVAIWDTANGRLVTTLRGTSRSSPSTAYFSPDRRLVLMSTSGGEARLWDAQTGEPASPVIEIFAAGASATAGAIFSPDGRWLATVGARGVSLWNAATLTQVREIPAELPGAGYLFFSRDGTRLVAGAGAQVWDVPSGEQITEPTDEHKSPGGVLNMRFSPDGRYLMTQSNVAKEVVVRVRALPAPLGANQNTPDWLLQLTAVLAGKSINNAEASVSDPGSMAQIEDVRRQLATLPADAPYVEWGRWILDERADRPIAPGFSITAAEMEKLVGEASSAK